MEKQLGQSVLSSFRRVLTRLLPKMNASGMLPGNFVATMKGLARQAFAPEIFGKTMVFGIAGKNLPFATFRMY